MNIYSEAGSNLQQIGGEKPNGWIKMNSERPDGGLSRHYIANEKGEWMLSEGSIIAENKEAEISWREEQLPIARNNVTAIEYGEPGDAQAWKAYWLALRKWNADNPDFPDATKRPQAPS